MNLTCLHSPIIPIVFVPYQVLNSTSSVLLKPSNNFSKRVLHEEAINLNAGNNVTISGPAILRDYVHIHNYLSSLEPDVISVIFLGIIVGVYIMLFVLLLHVNVLRLHQLRRQKITEWMAAEAKMLCNEPTLWCFLRKLGPLLKLNFLLLFTYYCEKAFHKPVHNIKWSCKNGNRTYKTELDLWIKGHIRFE